MRKACFLASVLLSVVCAAVAGGRRRRRPVLPMPGKTILAEGFEKGLEGWSMRPPGAFSLVEDAKAAHGRRNCVTSKVDADRKANFLERPMTFNPTSIYRFQCWARSSHPRGKLVLWRRQDGTRQMMGAWQAVGKRWRKYQGQFSVPEGGEWTLQVIAPSSHGAPPCTMWVDDITLVETRIAPASNLTDGEGYASEPGLAADGAGTFWTSWLTYLDGADCLMAGRLVAKGDGYGVADARRVPTPEGSYILGTDLVGAQQGAWLVYACESDRNWDIYAWGLGSKRLAEPRRITRSAAVDCRPAATVMGGKLWVAWESNRDGARQVYLSAGAEPKPTRISRPEANSYAPAIAEHQGGLWVAWHAFADGNYDIYGRSLKNDGALAPVQRLTRDTQVDRHPRLASAPHGLWLAWQRELMPTGEVETTRQYRTGVIRSRETWLCRWTPAGLEAAAGLGETILPQRAEMPSLAVDAQGRIWVTARRGRGQHLGWDSVLQCFAGQAWSEPRHLSTRVGWDGRAAIAAAGGHVLVAYQVGRTPRFNTAEESVEATSDVLLTSLPLSEGPRPAPPNVEAFEETTEPHRIALLRKQLGEQTPRRSITYEGEKLGLFWGDLHEHTSISICNRWGDTSPEDNYANERDIVAADFSAMTDHGYNFNAALWNRMAKINRLNHDPGRFVTFLAEEWTSTFEKYSDRYPEGYYGHRNLIFADPYFPRWYNAFDGSTPRAIWDDLRRRKANFIHIPHQIADTGNVPTDWSYTDKVAQPVAEIFQARQSYEYEGCPRQAGRTLSGNFLQDAWAKGIVIGVIASPDHGGGQGKAAVYAPELTREALLDALRARRCYGTTAARIFLDVRVNGHLMGEEIEVPKGKPITVTAKAVGANDVDRIELCRSNQFIYTRPGQGREAAFTFTDRKPLAGKSYYYVRVQQTDGELAWSSPVWVRPK
ncbi:MAG: CehA/McbA family metallohydrolase [Planctomycetota bacterium]